MTVTEYLERSAARYPEKTAFSDANSSMTYRQVLDAARRIGTALIRRIGTDCRPVAVLIDRNVESLCAFLGTAMSRNFYVPVDVTLPPGRIRAIFSQVQPAAVIAAGQVPADFPQPEDAPTETISVLLAGEADEVLLAAARERCLDTDPLYAMCTSGSTGTPKAVLISHRSVLDFIPVFAQTFGLDEHEVFGNQAPFDFDVSVKDIYTALYCGASLYILPRVCFAMPKLLPEQLDDRKITVIVWAVSALCVAAGFDVFRHRIPGSLRKILFSGEVMPVKMLNVWRRYFPDAMFVNLYGPTEVTCNCTYYILDREFSPGDRLPLGRAFPNEGVICLDENDRPVAPGGVGEICVTGSCLALGYYRDPERTAAAFVQNPRNHRYPERMYRTGDLAELGQDGEYYFTARKDFQIKHMGHRIELEEIEARLQAAEGVDRACCLFDADRNRIVAYYTGTAEKPTLIEALRKDLPKYMIPNVFVPIPEMPLTHNGKIDRQRLRAACGEGR